jgi:hypothetical protein
MRKYFRFLLSESKDAHSKEIIIAILFSLSKHSSDMCTRRLITPVKFRGNPINRLTNKSLKEVFILL